MASAPTNLSSHNVEIREFEHRLEVDRNGSVDNSEGDHIVWGKASENDIYQYKCLLDNELDGISVPSDAAMCADTGCNNSEHVVAIDVKCNDVINACLQAGNNAIPQTKRGHKTVVPYWNECVRHHKETSLFWHWI